MPEGIDILSAIPRDLERDAPMRIVHVVKHCHHANGSVHVAVDLACMQARAGDAVMFASNGGTFVDLLEAEGVRHVTMRQDQTRPHTLLRSGVALAALARRFRPDVLHAHMMGGAAIAYAASRVAGIPLVTTVHNSFDRHSVLMRLGDRVVAVSEHERSHLIERGYKAERVRAIWNAPSASPRHAVIGNDRSFTLRRPSVVAICGLHRRKGVFDIIDACGAAFRDIPGWHLTIAGEGPDRAALEAQVRDRGLADHVTFIGYLQDPRTIYEQADIFVLASYADPGSLSIGEARTAGCAIIGTAVGGTPEMLEHGGCGRLIPPGDVVRLEAELRALMTDAPARHALGRRARAGSEIFNVARLVPEYAAVYREAMAARRRGVTRPT